MSRWVSPVEIPGSSRACVTRAYARIALSLARRCVWRGIFLAGISVGAAGSLERPTRDTAAAAADTAAADTAADDAAAAGVVVAAAIGRGPRSDRGAAPVAGSPPAGSRPAGSLAVGLCRGCRLCQPVGLVAAGAWPVLLVALDAVPRRGEPGFFLAEISSVVGDWCGSQRDVRVGARRARARGAPENFPSAASAAAVIAGSRMGRRLGAVSDAVGVRAVTAGRGPVLSPGRAGC
ncbi:hypothetical protein Ae406Ps2_6196 [Pseudonocardia sp. Ae406_Ps2]|nr:hypothetical protein Ae406Ps2_6196 [Pseudonocardia sp. Ae406_Ps2]